MTTGPKSYKGQIGQHIVLDELDTNPFVKFDLIELDETIELPDAVSKDLSTDQAQLLAYVNFITKGQKSTALSWKLGKLCHSRWLTMASRVLCLYTKTANPSSELILLTKFIIQVYSVSWFDIKKNCHWQEGTSNLFKLIKRVNKQPKQIMIIALPVIQRNAYFAMPDNILSCMLNDKNKAIRDEAIKIIENTRKNDISSDEIDRTLPVINWNANHYSKLIDWESLSSGQLFEPSITKKMSMNELQELSKIDRIKLENFSCHTQAVERGVKCVSGAVLHHYEHDDQHGSILQGIESRNKHKNTYQKNCYDVSNLIGLNIAQGG